MNKKKLNIGCGYDIKKDYINLDFIKLKDVDVVHDIEKFPFPFKNNQFDEIYCSHVLEHLDDLRKIMSEFYRIGNNKCKIKILVPYFSSTNFWGDPTHKKAFNLNTFNYFNNHYYNKNIFINVLNKKIFFFSCKTYMKSRWYSYPLDFLINLLPNFYQRFFCYILPASEIHYLLEIKKK